jgi:hypothetical protein
MRFIFPILYLWWAFWLLPVFQGVIVGRGHEPDDPRVLVYALAWPVTLPPAILHLDLKADK